jgi:hypothetical protein
MENGNAEIPCDRGATCDHFGRNHPVSSTISVRMKPSNRQICIHLDPYRDDFPAAFDLARRDVLPGGLLREPGSLLERM